MAGTPKVKIGLDFEGLQNAIDGLNKLAQQPGKIGEAAAAAIKPVQKLLNAAQRGTSVTNSEIQEFINKIATGQSKVKSAINSEIAAFDKEAKRYQDTRKEVECLTQALQKLEQEQRQLTKSTGLKTLKDWAADPEQLKKRAVQANQKNFEDKDYEQAYRDFYATADQANISAYSKRIRENINHTERATLAKIDAAKELEKQYQNFANAEANATKKEEDYAKKLAETNRQLTEKQRLLNSTKQSLENKDATFDENGNPVLNTSISNSQQTFDVLNKTLEQTTNNIQTVAEEGKAAGNSIFTLGKQGEVTVSSFTKFTSSVLKSQIILRSLRRLLNESINAIKSMDESITNMSVVTGKSRQELQSMTGEFANMAKATSSTITEIANLTTEFLRQGRTMSDAKELSIETAKAAKIAGISVSDSITYMTAAINGFNLAATEASHVSDIFAKLAAESATDYESLAVALSKVSAQANQAGMSIEYTTALLAKGIETTQEAPESIGTALKTVIARFRELRDYGSTLEDGVNVNNVEAALKAVGIAARDESGAFRDLTDILNELGPKWDNLSTMQRQAIAQAAAGTRQQSRFLAIMQNWDRTLELVNDAQEAAGASAAQYAEYSKGLTASITNLQSAWQYFVTTLTESDWIVNAVDRVSSFISDVANFFDMLGPVIPAIAVGIAGIVGYSLMINKLDSMRLKYLNDQAYAIENVQTSQQQIFKEQLEAHIAALKNKNKEIEQQASAAYAQKKQTIAQQIADKKAHIARLEAIRSERVAELKGMKAVAQAANDTEQVANIDQKLKNYRSGANKDIRIAKKELAALNAEQVEITNQAADEYAKYSDAIAANNNKIAQYENLIKSLTSSLFSIKWKDATKNIRNLFAQLQNLKKGGIFKTLLSKGKSIIKQYGGVAATFASVAAALGAIYVAWKSIKNIINTDQNMLSDIANLTSDTYSRTSNNSKLTSLKNEYIELDKKVNKTADDMDRMASIEEQLATDYNISGSNLIEQIDFAMAQNNVVIAQNMQNAIADSFQAAIVKGEDMFQNAKFITTVQTYFESQNKADKSTAKGQYQSNQYKNISKNIDYAGLMSNVKNQKQNDKLGANIGLGTLTGAVGGSLAFAAGAAALGATQAWNPFGWVALAIAGVAATVAGITHIIKKNNGDLAKEMADEMTSQMLVISNEVNAFTEVFADSYDKNISTTLTKYREGLEKTSSATQEYIKATYIGLNALSEKYDSLAESERKNFLTILDKMQGTMTNEAFMGIIDSAGEMGGEAAAEFLDQWTKMIESGASSTDALKALYMGLSGADEASIAQALVRTGMSSEQANKLASISKGGNIQAMAQEYSDTMSAQYKQQQNYGLSAQNLLKTDGKDQLLNQIEKGAYGTELANNYNYLKGLTATELDTYLQSYIKSAEENLAKYDVDEITNALQTAMLDQITTIRDTSSLKDQLTSFDTATKNAKDFADAIREGTTTLEQWSEAATTYSDVLASDEWKAAVATGNTDVMAALIEQGSNVFTLYEDRQKQINATKEAMALEYSQSLEKLRKEYSDENGNITDYTSYQEALDAAEQGYKAQMSAIDQMTALVNILTKNAAATDALANKLEHANRLIEDGNLSGYNEKNQVLSAQFKIAQDKNNNYWQSIKTNAASKGYAGFDTDAVRAAIEGIRNGDTSLYNALMDKWNAMDATGQAYKEFFAQIYEEYNTTADNIEEIQDAITQNEIDQRKAIIDLQNESIEAWKAAEEEKYNATKDSLDKRKKLYQKYFDELNNEAEASDYESQRNSLLTTISALATSSDANSLKKLKDAQEALADLEKEQRDSEREAMQDATMDALDAEGEQLDEIYNKAIENNAAIWDNFQSLGRETLYELYKAADNYDKMTDEQKTQWDYEHQYLKSNLELSGIKKNKDGGLVDYTGLAWVDGTTSQPEAFLNASQTALFADLAARLETISNNNSIDLEGSGSSIGNLNINISGVNTSNPQELANTIYETFRTEMNKRGIGYNRKK